jgi:hypothetical protein
MDTNTLTRLTYVEAELNYLADSSEKPVTYMYTPHT